MNRVKIRFLILFCCDRKYGMVGTLGKYGTPFTQSTETRSKPEAIHHEDPIIILMTMTALHLYLHILPALVIFNIATSFSPFIKPDSAQGRICRESGNCPLHMTQFDVETKRELYNIENSSWSSPQWNWGSAIGTHE